MRSHLPAWAAAVDVRGSAAPRLIGDGGMPPAQPFCGQAVTSLADPDGRGPIDTRDARLVDTLGGMTSRQISVSATIEAPPSTVFAIVADPHQHSRIDGSGSVGSMIDGPDRITGTGQSFTVKMRMFGLSYRMQNHVVEFEADRLIAWRTMSPIRWRYELKPTEGGGTRVTETFDYSRVNPVASVVLRIAGFPARNRRGITETLVRLKKAAETEATLDVGRS